MTRHAYLFETHSIQHYILDSGRLAEMIGASELVESLTGKLLGTALEALELEEGKDLAFSRRVGGAITAFFSDEEKAIALRDLWGLLVEQYAPGLAYSHLVVAGANDVDAAAKGDAFLRLLKHSPQAVHPPGVPPARRSPRTGLPASDLGTPWADDEQRREWVDRASCIKSARCFRRGAELLKKFQTPEGTQWPTLLDGENEPDDGVRFPFLPDNRYVGILHADGNELGTIVARLAKRVKKVATERYAELFKRFSDAVGEATRGAAAHAAAQVLKVAAEKEGTNVFPARPLVLGGDDLTLILRGDLALDFARCFIDAFETRTAEIFAQLKQGEPAFAGLPDRLTACAGIAFVKSTQPFYLAYDLAEGMCRHAKDTSRGERNNRAPEAEMSSCVLFGRVTTSFIDRYPRILDSELTITHANTRYCMTLGAFAVGSVDHGLPSLTDLQAFKEFLAKPGMARGPGRKLVGLLHTDPSEAKKAYTRWRENLQEEKRKKPGDHRLADFDRYLRALHVDSDDLPYTTETNGGRATPLGDALAWMAVDGSIQDNDNE